MTHASTDPTKPRTDAPTVPWRRLVAFHREIAEREEEEFFTFDVYNKSSERFAALNDFELGDADGPWLVRRALAGSATFFKNLAQRASIYLGGPGFWVRTQVADGREWQRQPLLYREVSVTEEVGGFHITPGDDPWLLTPVAAKLLEWSEEALDISLEELAQSLVNAPTDAAAGAVLADGVARNLQRLAPSLSKAIDDRRRWNRGETAADWVLFSGGENAQGFGRNLRKDYKKLEELLAEKGATKGGLVLLDGEQVQPVEPTKDLLRPIRLNPSQENAVRVALSGQAVTVVEGPPGTGKSQVVLALLLQAWADGKSALFASTNNQAVNVVCDRVREEVPDLPIIVRAGASKQARVADDLASVRNELRAIGETSRALPPEPSTSDFAAVAREIGLLEDLLNNGSLQRIEEIHRSALGAYARYRAAVEPSQSDMKRHIAGKSSILYLAALTPIEVRAALADNSLWQRDLVVARQRAAEDEQKRQELAKEIDQFRETRRNALLRSGVSSLNLSHVGRLDSRVVDNFAKCVEQVSDFLSQPLENQLRADPWNPAWSKWKSAADASGWLQVAGELKREHDELANREARLTTSIDATSTELSGVDNRLAIHGIIEPSETARPLIKEWLGTAGHLFSRPRWLRWIPGSEVAKSVGRIANLRRQIVALIPATGMTASDAFQFPPWAIECERRFTLLERLAVQEHKVSVCAGQRAAKIHEIRDHVAAKHHLVSADRNGESSLRRMDELTTTAEEAAVAHHARERRRALAQELRELVEEWDGLSRSEVLGLGWMRSGGQALDAAIRAAVPPTPERVGSLREHFRVSGADGAIDMLRIAVQADNQLQQSSAAIDAIPSETARFHEWWSAKPARAFLLEAQRLTLPEEAELSALIDVATLWLEQHDNLATCCAYAAEKARTELDWACTSLVKLENDLLDSNEAEGVRMVVKQILDARTEPWPVEALGRAVQAFTPSAVNRRAEKLSAELKAMSLISARRKWLERLRGDDKAAAAVADLCHFFERRSAIQPNQFSSFQHALRAAPVWCLTALSAQSIPLAPCLFDMVIIDEASQCTLTNLLPLVYRAKTLVVIGDDHQLQAIPSLSGAEERSLARKHEVSAFVPRLGHQGTNVYRVAERAVPRHQITTLKEHYRSHPQVIGFSNVHIYNRELLLRAAHKPSDYEHAGFFFHDVPGAAERGKGGVSWLNVEEAREVLEWLLQRVKSSRPLTFGVVTPFAAQRKHMQERVDAHKDLKGVVEVGTAHTFQGAERDIMVFSPVAARGITDGAAKWVAYPPNLINVAVTRARQALHVFGDQRFCLGQDSLLRNLAEYGRSLGELRGQGREYVILFDHLAATGWTVRVEPVGGSADFFLRAKSGAQVALKLTEEGNGGSGLSSAMLDAVIPLLIVPRREAGDMPYRVIAKAREFLA